MISITVSTGSADESVSISKGDGELTNSTRLATEAELPHDVST